MAPRDESLNDIALPIGIAVEFDWSSRANFVFLRRNDRCYSKVQKVGVDPVGAISLVARQGHGPGN